MLADFPRRVNGTREPGLVKLAPIKLQGSGDTWRGISIQVLLKIVFISSSRKSGSMNAESGNVAAFLISGSTKKSLLENSLMIRIQPFPKRLKGHVYSDTIHSRVLDPALR